jgi:uncharacterized protein DUF1963
LPIGASRIGGLPDLPPGQQWPQHQGKKIPFVAQLNLADFPAAHKLFPADGHLFAFALISNDPQHRPAPISVFLNRGEASTFTRASAPAADAIWPDWGGERMYQLLPATAVPRGRDATTGSHERGGKLGWLFGEMSGVYGTAGELADQRFQDGDDWINLLAVESQGSMMWSDSGDLYFLIRRSALEKLDFSNVIAEACST